MSSERPFQIQRIDHVVLRVQDLPRAVRFYRDVLGCTVARERPSLGMVHLHAGESMIDLVSVDGPLGVKGGAAPGREGRNVDHLCLRVEPFDEADVRAHLEGQQLTLEGKAERNYGAEGDGLSLRLRDPDGNLVELKGRSSDCG
ncbi:VOC family protein [Stenotrophomonas sp. TWI587]|jgi:glyoxylase I family protein|uniref:VOC family protein n=1 Tax=unclassified Stenotrophomonas TaxID=196198 RepID=UPI0032085431